VPRAAPRSSAVTSVTEITALRGGRRHQDARSSRSSDGHRRSLASTRCDRSALPRAIAPKAEPGPTPPNAPSDRRVAARRQSANEDIRQRPERDASANPTRMAKCQVVATCQARGAAHLLRARRQRAG
jgi:hypothetical protein